jgi:hypothetical protein
MRLLHLIENKSGKLLACKRLRKGEMGAHVGLEVRATDRSSLAPPVSIEKEASINCGSCDGEAENQAEVLHFGRLARFRVEKLVAFAEDDCR